MSETEHADMPARRKVAEPFIKRIQIKNYKSIGICDIALGPLTVLVGRNGSGKSNFLDALRFVVDGLQAPLDHALKSRGGVEQVRRRSTGHPRNLAIWLEMELPDGHIAKYGFEIGSRREGGFFVKQERLEIRTHTDTDRVIAYYRVEKGKIKGPSFKSMPPALDDRLYLVDVAGLPAFRAAYDALSSMGFYNLNPEAMKAPQSPDAGELLHRDGSNIASVFASISSERDGTKERIQSYLDKIVPGITEVDRVGLGPMEALEFRQQVARSKVSWRFYPASMSDGTLRAFGSLVAVTQLGKRRTPVRLVGIEEPETALHPAAAGALMDAFREASSHTQVLVTTHSPDLLDQIDSRTDTLLAVQSRQGTTQVAPVDPASHEAIRQHLYTAGELLRMDQLQPDETDLQRQEQQMTFGFSEDEP